MAVPTSKQWQEREDQAEYQTFRTTPQKFTKPQETVAVSNSNMEVDTHLGDKEFNTNAFLKNEVVEEELTDADTKVV